MGNRKEVEAAQGALAGSWYVRAYEGDEDYFASFREFYPDAIRMTSGYGYALVEMLHEAAQQGVRGQELLRFLDRPQGFTTILGHYRMGSDGRFDLPVEVAKIR